MNTKKGKGTLSMWKIAENDFPEKGGVETKIKFLLRYAVLAPSGHNTQPWKFKIIKNKLLVLPDYENKRPVVDPDDRELFISLGCAIKNIEVAADYFEMWFDKKYSDGGVEITFTNGVRESRNGIMFRAILERSTNRGEFKIKKIPKSIIKNIALDGVKIYTDETDKKQIAEVVYSSNKVWFKSKQLLNELDYWLTDDLNGTKNGVSTGILNLYKIAVNLKDFLTKDSPELEKKALREKNLALNSPAIIALFTPEDKKIDWIKTGEKYEQLALWLTSQKIDNGFFNTVVELKTQRKKIENILKNGKKIQMLVRIGYGKEVPNKTPRRVVKYEYEPTSIH